MDCPARGQVGEGNITIHSRKRQRYWCTVCKKAFSARANTPYYRRRTDEETITRVVTLVDHGCPIPAVEAAFGFQAQTVREWMQASGRHSEAVHHHLVVRERELVQVQADEIRVKPRPLGRGEVHREVAGLTVDTGGRTPAQVVQQLAEQLERLPDPS